MPTKYGLIVGGALNLREQPSTSANRPALIPNETTLAVVYSGSIRPRARIYKAIVTVI